MSRPMKITNVALKIACVLLLASHGAVAGEVQPQRDINDVLAAHREQLMRIRGVVGVYVGLADDDKTECIRVMLAKDDPAARAAIPRQLEGYLVLVEVTGEIRPLKPAD
jgi:hypothetical protein